MLSIFKRSPFLYAIRWQINHCLSFAYQFKETKPFYYPQRENLTRPDSSKQISAKPKIVKQNSLQQYYYYKILGIKRNSSAQQIKTAYYDLAKKFHPDTARSAQETKTFRDISDAYNTLSDEAKRMEYDRVGFTKTAPEIFKAISGNTTTTIRYSSNAKEAKDQLAKDDFFKMASSNNKLNLTFMQATKGTKEQLDVKSVKKCPSCGGMSKKLYNRTIDTCRKCGGTGQLRIRTKTFSGNVVCEGCNGKRFVSRNQCETCENRGFILETTKLTIQVPPGTKTGDIISANNPANNQKINVTIDVAKCDYFGCNENDILTDKYLTISEAVLGGKFKIRGIYEQLELQIPPGVESHSVIVINGKGIRTKSGAGNHIVTVKVKIPRHLTTKQRQLILALAKTEDPTFDASSNAI